MNRVPISPLRIVMSQTVTFSNDIIDNGDICKRVTIVKSQDVILLLLLHFMYLSRACFTIDINIKYMHRLFVTKKVTTEFSFLPSHMPIGSSLLVQS